MTTNDNVNDDDDDGGYQVHTVELPSSANAMVASAASGIVALPVVGDMTDIIDGDVETVNAHAPLLWCATDDGVHVIDAMRGVVVRTLTHAAMFR